MHNQIFKFMTKTFCCTNLLANLLHEVTKQHFDKLLWVKKNENYKWKLQLLSGPHHIDRQEISENPGIYQQTSTANPVIICEIFLTYFWRSRIVSLILFELKIVKNKGKERSEISRSFLLQMTYAVAPKPWKSLIAPPTRKVPFLIKY